MIITHYPPHHPRQPLTHVYFHQQLTSWNFAVDKTKRSQFRLRGKLFRNVCLAPSFACSKPTTKTLALKKVVKYV